MQFILTCCIFTLLHSIDYPTAAANTTIADDTTTTTTTTTVSPTINATISTTLSTTSTQTSARNFQCYNCTLTYSWNQLHHPCSGSTTDCHTSCGIIANMNFTWFGCLPQGVVCPDTSTCLSLAFNNIITSNNSTTPSCCCQTDLCNGGGGKVDVDIYLAVLLLFFVANEAVRLK